MIYDSSDKHYENIMRTLKTKYIRKLCLKIYNSLMHVVQRSLNHLSIYVVENNLSSKNIFVFKILNCYYIFSPKAKSPASPKPGTIYALAFNSLSIAPTQRVVLSGKLFST